ncbi:hypothetical protein ACIP98_08730 [Streptomyces sp. NPDC088354]|uniref:hypothetical protein n=1 Tax=Streptomyces sp. NPDC088354 TaxID=3365856 RepID=UPI0038144833
MAPRGTRLPIHGELGPDHVLVDADDGTAFIAVEGLTRFDVEWYPLLARPDPDPRRAVEHRLPARVPAAVPPLPAGRPGRSGAPGRRA